MVRAMAEKKKAPKPSFPQPRAEFAGELAPGPVSQSHGDRMISKKP